MPLLPYDLSVSSLNLSVKYHNFRLLVGGNIGSTLNKAIGGYRCPPAAVKTSHLHLR